MTDVVSQKMIYDWNIFCVILLSGKPISEIKYPAITICSQGWIPGVTQRAMNYQFLTYAKSKGHDVNNMTEDQVNQLKNSVLSGTKFIL